METKSTQSFKVVFLERMKVRLKKHFVYIHFWVEPEKKFRFMKGNMLHSSDYMWCQMARVPAELKYDACNHKHLIEIYCVHIHHPSRMQKLIIFALCFVGYQIQDTLASKYSSKYLLLCLVPTYWKLYWTSECTQPILWVSVIYRKSNNFKAIQYFFKNEVSSRMQKMQKKKFPIAPYSAESHHVLKIIFNDF